jgi:hypothetical protein
VLRFVCGAEDEDAGRKRRVSRMRQGRRGDKVREREGMRAGGVGVLEKQRLCNTYMNK